jgi:Protein of unknown function VcgC/VcgE (DUF2780)
MKTPRLLIVLIVAVAVAGAGCASGGGSTSNPSTVSTPSTATTTSTPPTTTTTTTTASTAGTANSQVGTAGALGLTDTLSSSLGLTGDQASGAVGSILSMAETKLPSSDYALVETAVPGAKGYVEKAKDLGAVTEPITDMNGLSAAYSKLGISPEVGSKLTPLVVNSIAKTAGPTVGGLLSSVVK